MLNHNDDKIEEFDSVKSSTGAVMWNIFIIIVVIIVAVLLYMYISKEIKNPKPVVNVAKT